MNSMIRKYPSTGTLLSIIFMLVLFLSPQVVCAEVNNIFVEDNANILTADDKQYIKTINETEFSLLEGQPQYAVVTLKNLDGNDSIEDYAEKKFQQLGIGQKKLDNGFLFVISIEDHKYRLETGYGVEDVITDSMKEDIVTDDVTDLLQTDQYGPAVRLVSQNLERLVKERYGNYDASKQAIIDGRERAAKTWKIIGLVIVSLIGCVLLGLLMYNMYIKKIKRQIEKQYVSKKMTGFVSYQPVNKLTGSSENYKAVTLSSYLAREMSRHPNGKQLLNNQDKMKTWLSSYLIEDVIIHYWRKEKESVPYNLSVYLDKKNAADLMNELRQWSGNFMYPLSENPYSTDQGMDTISQYMRTTTAKHKQALKIAKENKDYVEQVCTGFLKENRITFRSRVNSNLEIALMSYYFLKGQDLSDKNLLQSLQLDSHELNKAYRFAEKRRREIDSSQRQQALNDLTNMTLGTYYMQTLIWSSYHSSGRSSIGGGSGSSFGGGSSGGGGFSGGW